MNEMSAIDWCTVSRRKKTSGDGCIANYATDDWIHGRELIQIHIFSQRRILRQMTLPKRTPFFAIRLLKIDHEFQTSQKSRVDVLA